MVSKASDDFPLPLIPVITTNLFLGIEISIFLRLCALAPITSIFSSLERIVFFLLTAQLTESFERQNKSKKSSKNEDYQGL